VTCVNLRRTFASTRACHDGPRGQGAKGWGILDFGFIVVWLVDHNDMHVYIYIIIYIYTYVYVYVYRFMSNMHLQGQLHFKMIESLQLTGLLRDTGELLPPCSTSGSQRVSLKDRDGAVTWVMKPANCCLKTHVES
jgi:hypothetical protein